MSSCRCSCDACVASRYTLATLAALTGLAAWNAVAFYGLWSRDVIRPGTPVPLSLVVAGGTRRVLVSHFYHLPRVKLTYARAGREVYTVPAAERYALAKMPLLVAREVVALWAYYARPILAERSTTTTTTRGSARSMGDSPMSARYAASVGRSPTSSVAQATWMLWTCKRGGKRSSCLRDGLVGVLPTCVGTRTMGGSPMLRHNERRSRTSGWGLRSVGTRAEKRPRSTYAKGDR